MKYKSDMDIWWSDGSLYKSHNGIVECPHELPHPFIKLEEMKKAKPVIEDKPDWKQLAINAGLKGDDLKKFMKMNATNKQIKLDKLGENK